MNSNPSPELKPALVILYHGTNEVKAVEIRQKGLFKPWTYFAKNLHDAMEFGGTVIFSVAFLKKDIPDNWQVRASEAICTCRIVEINRINTKSIFKNTELESLIFQSNTGDQSDYAFNDNYSKYY